MLSSYASMDHFVPAASAMIGLALNDDGGISDTIEGDLAAKAGIGQG
jgi:hypothetical protein